jgi:hypothetical protein
MLHLLPIRWILRALVLLVSLIVLGAFYLGWIDDGDFMRDGAKVIRWSAGLATLTVVLLHIAWRWLPILQRSLFPYLGGRWSGIVQFPNQEGTDSRDVVLEVKHTLYGLKLLLESAESISWTLVVHAERNPDFEKFRLYYVYLNERKEGARGGGERYRGLAVLRVEWRALPEIHGDYFTETSRRGTLLLKREKVTAWWRLWR